MNNMNLFTFLLALCVHLFASHKEFYNYIKEKNNLLLNVLGLIVLLWLGLMKIAAFFYMYSYITSFL